MFVFLLNASSSIFLAAPFILFLFFSLLAREMFILEIWNSFQILLLFCFVVFSWFLCHVCVSVCGFVTAFRFEHGFQLTWPISYHETFVVHLLVSLVLTTYCDNGIGILRMLRVRICMNPHGKRENLPLKLTTICFCFSKLRI